MSDNPAESRAARAKRRQRARGAKHEELQRSLKGIDPTVAKWSDDFVFGRVWAGEDLTWNEQMLTAITALAGTSRPWTVGQLSPRCPSGGHLGRRTATGAVDADRVCRVSGVHSGAECAQRSTGVRGSAKSMISVATVHVCPSRPRAMELCISDLSVASSLNSVCSPSSFECPMAPMGSRHLSASGGRSSTHDDKFYLDVSSGFGIDHVRQS